MFLHVLRRAIPAGTLPVALRFPGPAAVAARAERHPGFLVAAGGIVLFSVLFATVRIAVVVAATAVAVVIVVAVLFVFRGVVVAVGVVGYGGAFVLEQTTGDAHPRMKRYGEG